MQALKTRDFLSSLSTFPFKKVDSHLNNTPRMMVDVRGNYPQIVLFQAGEFLHPMQIHTVHVCRIILYVCVCVYIQPDIYIYIYTLYVYVYIYRHLYTTRNNNEGASKGL